MPSLDLTFEDALLEKAEKYRSDFEQQNKVDISKEYEPLTEHYYNFLITPKDGKSRSFGDDYSLDSLTPEGFSPHMYLDKPGGYPTVGHGHKLFFERNGENAKKIVESLSMQVPERLKVNNLSYPQEINQYLSITNDQIEQLYDEKDTCLGLLSATSLPFKTRRKYLAPAGEIVQNGDAIEEYKKIFEKKQAIVRAYNELISVSIKLRARYKRYGRPETNLFAPEMFFTPRDKDTFAGTPKVAGCNHLVISKQDAKPLAIRSIKIKIKELENNIDLNTPAFPDYRNYPLKAQLALLDVAYTSGVNRIIMNESFKKLTYAEKWDELAKYSPYPSRADSVYTYRNEKVKNWFQEAHEETKKG